MISLIVRIPKIKTNVQPAITKSLWQSAQLVRRTATQLAPYKTGTLRRSVTEYATGNSIEVGSNLRYARIHELGWVITPKTKPYLVFKYKGRWVKTKRVVIPKRPYLAPALQNNKQEILNIFTRNLTQYI